MRPGITIWSPRHGHLNVQVYAPGERVVPIPGSPIYPDHYAAAYWWPGTQEFTKVYANESDAAQGIEEMWHAL